MQLMRGGEAYLDGPSLGRGTTVLDERAAGVVLAVLQAYAARVGLPRCCACTSVKAITRQLPTQTLHRHRRRDRRSSTRAQRRGTKMNPEKVMGNDGGGGK